MIEKNSGISGELRNMLILRTEPVAVKLTVKGEDVQKNAIYPMRDMGKHMALCQAVSLARRNNRTVYLEKADHWCWNPLVGLGLVDCGEGTEAFDEVCKYIGISDGNAARSFFAKFPRLPMNKYEGIIIAPLCAAEFEPDVTLIYMNNAQLRNALMAIKNRTGKLVETQLDAIDSCVYEIVPPMTNGEYRVTIPDMGEHERAMTGEDEVVLSVPGKRTDELLTGLRSLYNFRIGYPHLSRDMYYDFPRPPFYNKLFELWGLDQGDNWGASK